MIKIWLDRYINYNRPRQYRYITTKIDKLIETQFLIFRNTLKEKFKVSQKNVELICWALIL